MLNESLLARNCRALQTVALDALYSVHSPVRCHSPLSIFTSRARIADNRHRPGDGHQRSDGENAPL